MRARRDSVTVGTPIPGDSGARRIDSLPGLPDSLPTPRVRRDSIQPPLTRGELPTAPGIGAAYRWTRDSILATGAVTALDLLERVPGLTGFRSGWLASAQQAAYLGDFRRVRVFRDGVELDPIDPRSPGVLDLPDVQLWQLDEVLIERTAGEVRLHMRTWTVRNTTPFTRVDVATGDEDTNLYRGFYGRRFGNGGAFQLGAERVGTGARSTQRGGGGDITSLFGRFGWARGRLSVDAVLSRVDRGRDPTFEVLSGDTALARYDGRRDEAYLRVGYGDPDAGPWVQGMANALGFTLGGTGFDSGRRDTTFTPAGEVAAIDTVLVPDSAASNVQYVLTGGFTRWGVRLSGADRYRVGAGRTSHSPALRAAFDRDRLSLSAFAERAGIDSTTRLELTARVQPLRWLAVLGAYSRIDDRFEPRVPQESESEPEPEEEGPLLARRQEIGTAEVPVRAVWRAELGTQLGRLWVTGGRVLRTGGRLRAPDLFARRQVDVATPVQSPFDLINLPEPLLGVAGPERAGGTIVTARGPVYKDLRLDIWGTAWDQGGPYRPQYQARTELRLETNWRRRFPSGNFGFVFAVTNEYRSRVPFPTLNADGTEVEIVDAPASNTLNVLAELRILQGTVTYQLRNALNREYQLVPRLTLPGPINFYGVRWTFFN